MTPAAASASSDAGLSPCATQCSAQLRTEHCGRPEPGGWPASRPLTFTAMCLRCCTRDHADARDVTECVHMPADPSRMALLDSDSVVVSSPATAARRCGLLDLYTFDAALQPNSTYSIFHAGELMIGGRIVTRPGGERPDAGPTPGAPDGGLVFHFPDVGPTPGVPDVGPTPGAPDAGSAHHSSEDSGVTRAPPRLAQRDPVGCTTVRGGGASLLALLGLCAFWSRRRPR